MLEPLTKAWCQIDPRCCDRERLLALHHAGKSLGAICELGLTKTTVHRIALWWELYRAVALWKSSKRWWTHSTIYERFKGRNSDRRSCRTATARRNKKRKRYETHVQALAPIMARATGGKRR